MPENDHRAFYDVGFENALDWGKTTLVERFGEDKASETIRAARDEYQETRPDIPDLKLKTAIYSQTAAYGHFGRPEFSWEQTDKAEILKQEAGL